jgi:proline dehydrogenase
MSGTNISVQVMPYLSRRAVENKSMLGNGAAEEECSRAKSRMWRRITGN